MPKLSKRARNNYKKSGETLKSKQFKVLSNDLDNALSEFLDRQHDLPPEARAILDKKFWDLIQ